jgi:hypothetical protein
LGLYSGAVLGSMGSWVPCNRTYYSLTCVRVATALGGAVGLAGGIALGDADSERLGDAAIAAGVGVLVGAAAGIVMKPHLQRFSWLDVAAVGVMGGAVGASAPGSAIGFGAGALVGLVLWRAAPGFELSDAIGLSLVGLAAGGLAAWVYRGIDAQSKADAPSQQLSVPIGLTLTF